MNSRILTRPQRLLIGLTSALAVGTLASLGGQLRPARADAPAAVNCDVDSSQTTWRPDEIQLLDQTNAYRATHGVAPLEADMVLTRIALWKAGSVFDVLRSQGLSAVEHNDPTRTWQQRFVDCMYTQLFPTAFIGENLNGGSATASATLADFEASPLHNKNLLDPNFTTVGIKHVVQADPANSARTFSVWLMTFGSELDQDPLATPAALDGSGGQASAGGTESVARLNQ